jgi:hypothetical protein
VALLVSNEQLNSVTSPYQKALDWITFVDPMALTPGDANFVQRYLLAYLYFATSAKKPWNSDCAPADLVEGRLDSCKWSTINLYRRDSFRWLSGIDECSWAGIDCDESSQIRGVDLSTWCMVYFVSVMKVFSTY